MDIELLKREIRYRGGRRGLKETDVTLGGFVQNELNTLTERELLELRDICFEPDQFLLAWLTDEQNPPKPEPQNSTWQKLKQHHQQRLIAG